MMFKLPKSLKFLDQSPCRWMYVIGAALLFSFASPQLVAQRKVAVEGFQGRLVEEEGDDDEGENVVKVKRDGVVFRVRMPNANVEIDENDPFAKIIKQQPHLAENVRMAKSQIEWRFGAELTFAARLFDVNDQQKSRMKLVAQEEIKKHFVEAAKQMQVQWIGGAVRQANAKPDSPNEMRMASLNLILQDVFGSEDHSNEVAEKYGKWRSECETRLEFRNTTNATVAVNTLDKRLFLSDTQHKNLVKAVANVWQEEWDYYLQLMPHNPQYFPPLPDECLQPHLDRQQMAVWKNSNYQQVGGMGWQFNGGGFFGIQQEKSSWFDDAEEGEE